MKADALVRTYTVKRWVVERYEVEVAADDPLSREQIAAMADDPCEVIVLRETVTKKREAALTQQRKEQG